MKVILYARFSPRPKRKSAECESIETQMDLMHAWCDREQHRPILCCWDRHVSGGGDGDEVNPADELTHRTGLWLALDHLPEDAALVVLRRERLARSVYASEYIRRRLIANHASLLTVQGMNGDQPHDKLVQHILDAVAEFDRRMIAVRTREAMRRHQASGRRMSAIAGRPFGQEGSCIPFGQRPDPCNPAWLVYDETEQAILHDIIAWRTEGAKLREIARRLNQAGRFCRGKPWHHSQITRIIRRAV